MKYKTQGVCATYIEYDLDEQNLVRNVRFTGGCVGNRQAIAALVEGMPVDEVVKRLRGIPCRNGTSCADQFAKALDEANGEAK